jgi:hypothetical protein
VADFQSVKPHFDSQNLSYYSFFHKSEKPIKAVIRHLPHNTPAEDISVTLVSLDFDVVSVKQMTATRRSPPEESKIINLPLFLVTLPRTAKSHKMFRLSSLCHIAIRVEAYRAQNALTQCNNCQQFGHVWANCKQPPRCLWCGRHFHKDCPHQHAVTAGWRRERELNALTSATTASSSATSELIANNLPAVCGAGDTSIRTAQRKESCFHTNML